MMSGRHHFNFAMPYSSDDNHCVVSFKPQRAKSGEIARWREPVRQGNSGILFSLAKFKRDDRGVDYRHRMTMNGLASVVTVATIAAGVWLVANLRG
jgi:hypothetical protein